MSRNTEYTFTARLKETDTDKASEASNEAKFTTDKTTINIAAISGVTVPVTGATPVTAITTTDQYTGTVTWEPADSKYKGNISYTATITLSPKADYTLTGVAKNFFTVSGATATNPVDSGVVTAEFSATDKVLTVTSNADDGGVNTLRNVIANADDGDTVTFDLPAEKETIIIASELEINGKNLTIDGENSGRGVVVAGGGISRVFNIDTSGSTSVTLKNMTVIGGNIAGLGGGIFISGNGRVTVDRCTLHENAAESGGAIYASSDTTVFIINATIAENDASGAGGGVYLADGGIAHIVNTTISGNDSSAGGGVYNSGSAYLLNSIVINNTSNSGADIYTHTGKTTSVYYSWYDGIAGDGTVFDQEKAPNEREIYIADDLGDLADNGGPTRTMALSTAAPAYLSGGYAYYNATDGFYLQATDEAWHRLSDWFDEPDAKDESSDKINTDQRGVTRYASPTMGAYDQSPTAPMVTTEAVTGITDTTATCNGDITDLGIPNPAAHGVCWAITANPTTTDSCNDKGATSATGAFTASITGLTPGTTYHVRAFATNTAGTVYGENQQFSTLQMYILTVNSGTGGGQYTSGTVANIQANAPAAGKIFDKWTGDVTHVANVNSASTTLTMPTSNVSVTATYKDLPPAKFALTVNNGSGSGEYEAGTVVNIQADAPAEGKLFDKWTGDVTHVADATSASTTLTMPAANVAVTATYKDLPPAKFALTVNNGSGSGEYEEGAVVDIQADAPAEGKIFDKWTGDVTHVADATIASTTLTMPAAKVAVTATYKDLPPDKFALTVNNGTGSGEYEAGYTVRIAAGSPEDNQIFHSWTGDVAHVANVNNPNTTVAMPAENITVRAVYINKPHGKFTLSVGSGTGSGEYEAGRTVGIAANPPADDTLIFDSWTGQTTHVVNIDDPNTAVIMPEGNVSVIAAYRTRIDERFMLTVISGTGSGEFEPGYVASIAASPAEAGMIFDQWTGNVFRVANIYNPNTVVTMSEAAITVRATYKEASDLKELRVDHGTGSGEYRPGRVVAIAADVRDGFIFERWVGQTSHVANVNIPNTTMVMPDAEVTVTATFKEDPNTEFWLTHKASVPVAGPLAARLVRSKTSNSGASEIQLVFAGRLVNLMAPPAPAGYTFDKWIGQTSHVDNIHQPRTLVYMPANDVDITATYRPVNSVSLAVENGTGSGNYQSGNVLDIVADAPAENMMFDKWEGQTTGVVNINRASTAIVMPDTDVRIRAVYREKPEDIYTLTVQSGTGDGNYEAASEIEIRSSEAPEGQMFARWSGQIATVADVNSRNTTLYMPPHEVTVVALFDMFHTITATAGEGGNISPSGPVDIIENEQAEFIVTPDSGFEIEAVTGCGGTLSGNVYTTAPITGACAVEATFTGGMPATHTVTAVAGTGGSISPSQRMVSHGQTTWFTVTPHSSYRIDRVTGCGGTLSGSTYTTSPVTANCQITALFSYVPDPSPTTYSINVSADISNAN